MRICPRCKGREGPDRLFPAKHAWCYPCCRAYDALRRQHPDRIAEQFARQLRRKYGITVEQYEALHRAQGGVCAVCHQPETFLIRGVLRRLAVDHDHDTGEVRGLLCSHCNTGIGKLGDDPARLRAAADYLERSRPTKAEIVAQAVAA